VIPNIRSEVGNLKTVMLHRPSWELERITPQDLEQVLFEDIPWLKKMQDEHDGFAKTLRLCGCEVLYAEDLLADVFNEHPEVKASVISEVLGNELRYDDNTQVLISAFLNQVSDDLLIRYLIGGLSRDDIDIADHTLFRYMPEDYKFYFSPLPNFYFMRDPAVVIADGVVLSVMHSEIRKR